MKKILTILILISSSIRLHSQNFQWVDAGMGNFTSTRIATDKAGNSYVCGSYQGLCAFTDSITGNGGYDGYLAMIDPSGTEQWLQKIGSDNPEHATDVATDESGNIYVVGDYMGDILIGNIPLTGGGGFIAKFSPSGLAIWANTISSAAWPKFVVCGDSGSVFVAGLCFTSIDVGCGSNVTGKFFARYDTTGNCQWVHNADTVSYIFGIACDHRNNLYATGFFNGNATFGDTTITANNFTQDIYLAKCSASGWQWAKRFGGSEYDQGLAIEVDEQDNVIATGYFEGIVDYDCDTLVSIGLRDIFILKMDSDGNCLWVKQAGGGNGSHYAFALTIDHLSNVFISGSILDITNFCNNTLVPDNENFYIAGYDKTGNCIWSVESNEQSSLNRGYDLSCDSSGNVYSAGLFFGGGVYTFGTIPVNVTSNGYDFWAFVSKIANTYTGATSIAHDFFLNVYPNPFSSSTIISFSCKENSRVVITLLDLAGRKMETALDEIMTAGSHQINFNRSQLSAGIYFLEMKTFEGVVTRKVMIE